MSGNGPGASGIGKTKLIQMLDKLLLRLTNVAGRSCRTFRGRGSGPDGFEDYGREQATGIEDDILKFRTPTQRNRTLTAPYGHSGAYDTLRAVVEHHLDAVSALYAYNDNRQAVLPTHPALDTENYRAMDDPEIVDFIAYHNELAPFSYSDEDVDRIIDFLHALTDVDTIDLRSDQDVVNGVPSGHPLAD